MGGIIRGDVVESTDVMVAEPPSPTVEDQKKAAEEAKKAEEAEEVKKPA